MVCLFVCGSSATFLGDDGEASCQQGLTEIKQKGRNGENRIQPLSLYFGIFQLSYRL